MNTPALVNGRPVRRVDIADRGFQYGDGVFTTVAVQSGIPLFLPHHLARLERDCLKLYIPFPEGEVLVRESRDLCRAVSRGVLKIQLTRGVGGRGYRCPRPAVCTRVLSLHPAPDYPPALASEGVTVRICQTRLGINPGLAGIKHMNRLEQILARAEWSDEETREGLMRDAEGHVVEGTMTNLFLIKDRVVYTPPLDRCGVAGVMRALVMAGARELEYPVDEKRVSLADVFAADELFLTNSVIGLWPIRCLEDRTFAVGPITRELSQWLTIRVRAELDAAGSG